MPGGILDGVLANRSAEDEERLEHERFLVAMRLFKGVERAASDLPEFVQTPNTWH